MEGQPKVLINEPIKTVKINAPKKSTSKKSLIVPKLRAKIDAWLSNKEKVLKTIEYVNVAFIILCIQFTISILFQHSWWNWKALVLGIAIYFIYEEVIEDVKELFRNFGRR